MKLKFRALDTGENWVYGTNDKREIDYDKGIQNLGSMAVMAKILK